MTDHDATTQTSHIVIRPDDPQYTGSWVIPNDTAMTLTTASPMHGSMQIIGAGTPQEPAVAINLDTGVVTFGPSYEPNEAARAFWQAIEAVYTDPFQVHGPGLTDRIDAELAAGEQAQRKADRLERKLQAIVEATVLWRDRPGGDVGLAVALASILDSEQPDAPTVTAMVRELREAQRKVKRLDQMAEAWKTRLPETVVTATVVEAVHQVTRPEAG